MFNMVQFDSFQMLFVNLCFLLPLVTNEWFDVIAAPCVLEPFTLEFPLRKISFIFFRFS